MRYVKPSFICLHLCPGCLWGRKFRDKNKIGHLNSRKDLTGFKHNIYVFDNIDKSGCLKQEMFPGGPNAFIINRQNIDSLIHDYKSFW